MKIAESRRTYYRQHSFVGNSSSHATGLDDEITPIQRNHATASAASMNITTPNNTKPTSVLHAAYVEENPSMLTATDDEFSFQSHPSQQSYDDDDDDDDDDDSDIATRREFAGATVAGAIAGLVLGGPLGAVAVAASSAYIVRSKSQAGTIARKGGESFAKMGDSIAKSPTGQASMQKGEQAMQQARTFWKQNKVVKRLQDLDSKHQIRQRAFCCSSEGATLCIARQSDEEDDESFFLQTVIDDDGNEDTTSKEDHDSEEEEMPESPAEYRRALT